MSFCFYLFSVLSSLPIVKPNTSKLWDGLGEFKRKESRKVEEQKRKKRLGLNWDGRGKGKKKESGRKTHEKEKEASKRNGKKMKERMGKEK